MNPSSLFGGGGCRFVRSLASTVQVEALAKKQCQGDTLVFVEDGVLTHHPIACTRETCLAGPPAASFACHVLLLLLQIRRHGIASTMAFVASAEGPSFFEAKIVVLMRCLCHLLHIWCDRLPLHHRHHRRALRPRPGRSGVRIWALCGQRPMPSLLGAVPLRWRLLLAERRIGLPRVP